MASGRVSALTVFAGAVGISEKLATYYIFTLAALALGLVAVWIARVGLGAELAGAACAATLAPVAFLSRRFPMRFGRTDTDLVDAVVLIAVALAGPLWALLVVAPASIYRPAIRTLYVASCDVLRVMAAGLAVSYFGEPLLAGGTADARFVNGLVLGMALFFAVDATLNLTLLRIKYRRPISESFREDFLPLIPANLAAAATVVASVVAFSAFGLPAAVALAGGILATFTLAYLVHDRQRRAESAEARVAEVEETLRRGGAYLPAALVRGLGYKDGYTDRHATASAVYARDLAIESGLGTERAETVARAALLQDVGLVSAPEEVLMTAPEKINSLGRRSLEQHPVESERLLSLQPGLEEVARWVRWHHEREDGSGYPDRLRGGWIPVESKIVALAAYYSKLVLDKPHRRGMSSEKAREALVKSHEREFDGTLVRRFLGLLDTRDANYAMAREDRFAPETMLSSAMAPTEDARTGS